MSPLGGLPTIGLAELNENSGLMTRFDEKYVLDDARLLALAASLEGRARVLREGPRETFRYRTVFFDDPGLRSYRDHAMGRIRRFKSRLRSYDDTGDAFVEAKMRLPRGQTVKIRRQVSPAPADPASPPTPEMLEFLASTLGEVLGVALPAELAPTVVVSFGRSTLVDDVSGERVTVDSNLVLSNPAATRSVAVAEGLHVVEVKSGSRRSEIGRFLSRGGSRPLAISKYCMGIGLTRTDVTANPWRPAMRMLGLVGDNGRHVA